MIVPGWKAMSIAHLPQDIMSVTVSELGIIDMIRVRRVSIQWKKLVEMTIHIKTMDTIEGDILTYFPKLRSYDGPIESLRDMVIKPNSQLLSLRLLTDRGLSSISFYFGIIRDYYRAKLASKLQADLIVETGCRGPTSFPFVQGLITFKRCLPAFIHAYGGLIGKEAEVCILNGGPLGGFQAKRVIYHTSQMKRNPAYLSRLLNNDGIKQLTIHLTQQQYDGLKVTDSEAMKRATFVIRPDDPPVESIVRRIGRRIVTSIPKEDDSDED